jgi:catalase
VTVRFSNGGGDPDTPDYAREGRGMAIKFYLADGGKTDIVGLSLPCFFVRTPEDFVAFMKARVDPERLMPDFLAAHPEALPAIQAALAADPPESYAPCLYNSIFDPSRVTAGIELSDDPILHFRPKAYSLSVARRTGG